MDFLSLLIIFALSCFVGFYVIWSVTPALHSPLMAVTNAISSVIVVGAIIAAGYQYIGFANYMGFIASTLAFINIFGGFVISYRMIKMFKTKAKNRG